MRAKPHILAALASLLLTALLGCTKAPDVPQLERRTPTVPQQIILGEELSARDVKEIFRSLNQNNQYEALRHLFEEPSEQALESVATLLTKYLYRETDTPVGLLSLLEKRVGERGFTKLLNTAEGWIEKKTYSPMADLALFVLSLAEFPELATRDVTYLDPQFTAIVHRLADDDSYGEIFEWEQRSPISADHLLQDLQKILHSEDLTKQIIQLSSSLEETDFGENLLKALRQLRKKHDGPMAFEGFAYGLRSLLTSAPDRSKPIKKNKLDLLMYFAAMANHGTEGFFEKLQESFSKDPDLIRFISQFAQPIVTTSIRTSIKRKVTDVELWEEILNFPPAGLPNDSKQEIYKKIYRSVAAIRGFHKVLGEDYDPFPSNLTTELNAFVLAYWLEEIVTKNREALLQIPEENFDKMLWKLNVKAMDISFPFVKIGEDGTVEFPLHDAMALRMLPEFEDTLSAFEKYLRERIALHFPYQLQIPECSLEESLKMAIEECEQVRSFCDDSDTFITALSVLASKPEQGIFASFDSSNIMDSLNRLIASSDLSQLRQVRDLIFKKMKIGTAPWDGDDGLAKALGPFFENQERLFKRTKQMILASQPLFYFDQPAAQNEELKLPSAFETYHALLQNTRLTREPEPTPPKERFYTRDPHHAMTLWLSFLSESEFFSVNEETPEGFALKFPAIGGFVEHAKGIARSLHALSQLDPLSPSVWELGEQETFLTTLKRSLGTFVGNLSVRSGVALHLGVAKRLLDQKQFGLYSTLDQILESGWKIVPTLEDISTQEREWLIRLVSNEDHRILWDFLRTHLDRRKALELVVLLKELHHEGDLRPAFLLLSQINNIRIERIARVLLDWSDSGELVAFLTTLEKLLTPIQEMTENQSPPAKERFISIQ